MFAGVLKGDKVMGRLIDVFVVYEVIDEYGRNGGIAGVYSTRDRAKAAAHKQGAWGLDNDIIEHMAFQFCDGSILLIANQSPTALDVDVKKDKARRRAEAIAKLSECDLEVLGLKREGNS